ncbi:MAG: hypothetical protein LBL90_01390 [Prevotellaceae bacterium]|jgi:hypothetical protein|nr:hypothetical protein [Prevotellaceae bacterium]
MGEKYQISVGSPIDYEELVVSIIIDNKEIIQIDQENGKNNLKIEFSEYAMLKKFDYDTIFEALQEAKKELLK